MPGVSPLVAQSWGGVRDARGRGSNCLPEIATYPVSACWQGCGCTWAERVGSSPGQERSLEMNS